MKIFTSISVRVALGAALLGISSLASATVVSVNVDSRINSVSGGTGSDTGIQLTSGETFAVTVDPEQLWNFSGGNGDAWSNANGSGYSLTEYGFTDWIGALVGMIGNGAYFHVGTDFSGSAGNSGDLKLFYWDSDADNNSGFVTAAITVPEPDSLALVGLALAGLAVSRRRKL